jgi:hypothetical protein
MNRDGGVDRMKSMMSSRASVLMDRSREVLMMNIGDIDTLVGVGAVSEAEADQGSAGGGDPVG